MGTNCSNSITMDKNIYFQSSLPRSGSTLLQNVMGQNPEFYVTPTSGVIELLYAARGQFSTAIEFKAQDNNEMTKGFKSFCKNGLQGFYSGITDKPYVMDKSRGWGVHYPFLESFIDKPKVICMVRDLRDVYCSMEKNFRKNPEKSSGIVNWNTGQCTTVAKRVDYWADNVPVGLAITRLKEMIDRGIAENILFVRFEDFTRYPKQEVKRIYDFLDLPEYEHDFTNVLQITQEDDDVHGTEGLHDIRKEIKPVPHNYNEILGPEISRNIMNTYTWFNNYFNYK